MEKIAMVNLLVELFIPVTFMISVFLLGHKYLLAMLGVINLYRLWLIIPLSLLVYLLPAPWQQAEHIVQTELVRYVVLPTQEMQQNMSAQWAIYLWLTISITLMGYWLLSHIQFTKRLKLEKLPASSEPMLMNTALWPKNLIVYQSEKAYSPMLVGLLNQVLVLPKNFQQAYNQEQQQLILEHEICHFDRNDIYWNLMAFTLIALFWFHPLVWLAYFRFRRDQELSCDATVLARKQLASRINYSKALLVAAESAPPLAFAQLSFKKYGDKEIMFERIKQIKLDTKASKLSVSLATIMSVAIMSSVSYAGNIAEHSIQENKPTKYRVPPKPKKAVKPVVRVEPKYPIKAAHENIEGAVVLKFDVTADGDVDNIHVMNGVPAYVFDRVAIDALKQWKYEATGEKHKNHLVQLDFRLDKNSSFKGVDLIEKIKVTQ